MPQREVTWLAKKAAMSLSILSEKVPTRRPTRSNGSAIKQSTRLRVQWRTWARVQRPRSEEHTSELQSRLHLVCRLLLEKKKKKNQKTTRVTATPTRVSD